MDCSPPGFSVHGILQARILEWVAISFSRGSPQPRDQTRVSCIGGRRFNLCITKEALKYKNPSNNIKDFKGGKEARLKEEGGGGRRRGFDPWVRKIPWRRKWQPTPVLLPGESHGEAWWATVHGVTKSWTLEDQPWDFFARNDVRAETPVLFATSCEELLIGKKL